jgi:hypothetical protein
MERWYGTFARAGGAAASPHPLSLVDAPHHRGLVWLLVSLYNFVMPYKRLRQGRTSRTPAMSIGLTDHEWSYREYIWLPMHTDPILSQ